MIADTITLRPAVPDDAGAIADLLVQLYRAEVPGTLHGPAASQVRLFQHIVAYEIAHSIGGRYVVTANGQIVGSASLRMPTWHTEDLLPPGTFSTAIATIGIGDTLRLILSALRAALIPEVNIASGESYISSVVVDTNARGHGVGAAMMGQIEDEARRHGARAALLRVVIGNDTARRLYVRLGYQPVSRTPPILDRITFPSELMRKELG
ncbi:MAG: GNAT family N-acetyltransferase [Chloroflexales bacterium]